MLLKTLSESIQYSLPNFRIEWKEAERYPELKQLGLNGWTRLAKSGRIVAAAQLQNIGNIDLDISNLEDVKVDRVDKLLNSGTIELPIVIKINGSYELLSGNTRFALLVLKKMPVYVYLIDVS